MGWCMGKKEGLIRRDFGGIDMISSEAPIQDFLISDDAISIPENGSCGGWRSCQVVLRKKPLVASGYKKNAKESPFSRNLGNNKRVSFSEEYSTPLWMISQIDLRMRALIFRERKAINYLYPF